MGCTAKELYKYTQLTNVNGALRALGVAGLSPLSAPYRELYKLRGELMGKLLGLFPRMSSLLKIIVGLSPGELRVWFDNETGWMAEARETPGAPPVYRQITEEQAIILLKPNPPADMVHGLFKPDDYLGE